jgi:hypothetical protein
MIGQHLFIKSMLKPLGLDDLSKGRVAMMELISSGEKGSSRWLKFFRSVEQRGQIKIHLSVLRCA